MKTAVVIVAGGKGTRMGTEEPKQFLNLCGKPVLMHTIDRFKKALKDVCIVLVLPKAHQDYWHSLCEKYQFNIQHSIAIGGASRFASVKSGLEKIPKDITHIGVHDAVRPMVSTAVIAKTYDLAQNHPAVIPCIDVDDSLRMQTDSGNQAVDRSLYKRVQTPQVFQSDVLVKAYEQKESLDFTDDASVVEKMGYSIHITQGNPENIKITRPSDLILIASFMNR